MSFSSILTQIYNKSNNIYAINSFLPLYASLNSVGCANNETQFVLNFGTLNNIMYSVGLIA